MVFTMQVSYVSKVLHINLLWHHCPSLSFPVLKLHLSYTYLVDFLNRKYFYCTSLHKRWVELRTLLYLLFA